MYPGSTSWFMRRDNEGVGGGVDCILKVYWEYAWWVCTINRALLSISRSERW